MNFYNNYFKKIILKEDFFFIIVNILKILHWHVNEILYKNYPGYCRIKIIVGNKWWENVVSNMKYFKNIWQQFNYGVELKLGSVWLSQSKNNSKDGTLKLYRCYN